MSANLHTIVYNWLKELKIPVSKSYIKEQLLSHPDYPSLLSITDTLSGLGIENTAVKIEKEQFGEIDVPFLVHLNNDGGKFAVIKNKIQHENFFKSWGGIVVAAEKPANWHNKENAEWLQKDNKKTRVLFFTLSAVALFILLSMIISFDWTRIALLLIALAGILVSWMIVSKDLGIENKIADRVCGKEANCDAVIHSTVAKLPFSIGWSDAGIIYFSFLLIALLVSSFTGTTIYSLLALLSIAALPLTVISIYYQWYVLRKWCRLCFITIVLLWLQVIVLLPEGIDTLKNGFHNTFLNNAAFVIFLLITITAAWLWIKYLIQERSKLETEKFEALRFRNNPDIFNAVLTKQKRLAINTDGIGITIGNPNAENSIIKVSAAYCNPCAKAHSIIDELVERHENLKVQIIFSASDSAKEIRANPVRHLLALYEKKDSVLIRKALDDWYLPDTKDYDVFAKKYELNGELEKQGDKLKAMRKWCDEMKILATPTFFVNGFQLPYEFYSIKDIKLFINYLNSSKVVNDPS